MTTPMEVLDTAVKIGLGALISGVATYWVAYANNKNAVVKAAQEDRRKTIREISELIEESKSQLNEFIHLSWCEEREEANKRMADKLNNLIISYQASSRANTLANLLGLKNLTTAIELYSDTINDLREFISAGLNNFDENEGNRIISQINKCKDEIEPLISKSFADTYA